MSVLDDLRGLEARVATRMQQLRPMIEEYRELEQVAQRLGLDGEQATQAETASAPRRRGATRTVRRGGSSAKQATSATRASGRSTRRRSTRATRSGSAHAPAAAQGGRQQQVAELVKQRPGITVRELGKELGVDPTSLYRSVHRLEQDGTITKKGRELQPA
jgi:transposase